MTPTAAAASLAICRKGEPLANAEEKRHGSCAHRYCEGRHRERRQESAVGVKELNADPRRIQKEEERRVEVVGRHTDPRYERLFALHHHVPCHWRRRATLATESVLSERGVHSALHHLREREEDRTAKQLVTKETTDEEELQVKEDHK